MSLEILKGYIEFEEVVRINGRTTTCIPIAYSYFNVHSNGRPLAARNKIVSSYFFLTRYPKTFQLISINPSGITQK